MNTSALPKKERRVVWVKLSECRGRRVRTQYLESTPEERHAIESTIARIMVGSVRRRKVEELLRARQNQKSTA